ncbi:unnamed protein product [Caenorhabditis auriculariae]|uniref:Tyrosine-protein kinase n=1 Tax=Caenorhabditis auriculariae TaxID=2777116 RepID=A0A8S1HM33_9PELO|nr:unnamed protein product [Caenorhabditis auriculariae]
MIDLFESTRYSTESEGRPEEATVVPAATKATGFGLETIKGALSEIFGRKTPTDSETLKEERDEDQTQESADSESSDETEIDDDEFLNYFAYFHGYLPEMQLRKVLKKSGDYLLRKNERHGRTFLLFSVAVRGKTKGKKPRIEIKHYRVYQNEIGVYMEGEKIFKTLADFLIYYILHPHKEMLNINLLRGIPTNDFVLRPLQITLLDKLEKGSFSETLHADVVYLEKPDIRAVVKMLKFEDPYFEGTKKRFFEKARVLMKLRHKNIVRLIGWQIFEDPLMLVFEAMDGGFLDNWLIANFERTCILQLMRDIGARNCSLTADFKLKISNLDRCVNGDSYRMNEPELLPTRYLAPENLSRFIFTPATDCYTFGNLLYEIFTGGEIPYEELEPSQVKANILERVTNDVAKTKMPLPLQNYVKYLLWSYNPAARPGMDKIAEFLTKIIDHLKSAGSTGKWKQTPILFFTAASAPEGRRGARYPK